MGNGVRSGGWGSAVLLLLLLDLLLVPLATAQDAPGCVDGVVKDDGTVETGYGWVPSTLWGVFVQQFSSTELPTRTLGQACVCWLRTHRDSTVDFDVVVYEDVGGVPAMTPYASVAATATDVPKGVAAAGRFYDVDLSGIVVPNGTFYVGVRWNPSQDQYFFLCVDRSPETPVVGGFYLDDRSTEWGNVLDTPDPTFTGHRAMMVRLEAQPMPQPAVPALSGGGALGFALLLALAGVAVLARRCRP
jgi:hypothetical protein